MKLNESWFFIDISPSGVEAQYLIELDHHVATLSGDKIKLWMSWDVVIHKIGVERWSVDGSMWCPIWSLSCNLLQFLLFFFLIINQFSLVRALCSPAETENLRSEQKSAFDQRSKQKSALNQRSNQRSAFDQRSKQKSAHDQRSRQKSAFDQRSKHIHFSGGWPSTEKRISISSH